MKQVHWQKELPRYTLEAVDHAKEKTKNNTGLRLIFAINYGGRAEIVQSFKTIVDELQHKGLSSEDINEALINQHLMTKNYPDPELLMRTSGEQRISNFLVWQVSY